MNDRSSSDLLRQSVDAYLKLEADRLLRLAEEDLGGRLLFVTTTFPGRRFAASAWSSADARRAMLMVERASDDLHRAFRGFYIRTLVQAVDDFRHHNDLQPPVIAFIDDRQEGDLERYPHLHSVWFIPSAVVDPVTRWLGSPEAARAWAELSGGGALHVEEIDPETRSVERVVAYAGKLFARAEAHGAAAGALCRAYPDRSPPKGPEAARRPPQPRDRAFDGAPRRTRSRRRRGGARPAPPLKVERSTRRRSSAEPVDRKVGS